MWHVGPMMLALALAQPPKVEQTPEPLTPEEEMVLGHPEGDAQPLPEAVDWDLKKVVRERTKKRARISLAGWWRFAATNERKTPIKRNEMGYVQMPAAKGRPAWKITDGALKPADGMWHDQPAADFVWNWAERDITTPDWFNYQVFLVVRGPWSAAELYCNYWPVPGIDRDGGRMFNLTEQLIYGGTCPVALRLKTEKTKHPPPAVEMEPYIGLELMPVLPRFDGFQLRRAVDQKELEITIGLRRPIFFFGLGIRVSEIPLIVEFELEDAATGKKVAEIRQEIGTMPKEHHTVSVRMPMSEPGTPPPKQARLRSLLTSTLGGTLDVEFPREFEIETLPPAKAQPPKPAAEGAP